MANVLQRRNRVNEAPDDPTPGAAPDCHVAQPMVEAD